MDPEESKTPEEVFRQRPFRLSPMTKVLEEYLEGLDEGQVATYEDMEALIGMKCQTPHKGYMYLDSARNRLAKRSQHFATIAGVGVRKLHPNETTEEYSTKVGNYGRLVKKKVNELATADFRRMDRNQQALYHSTLVFGRIASRCCSEKARGKLVEDIRGQPDMGKIDYEGLTEIYLRGKT